MVFTGEVGEACRSDSVVCDGAQKTELTCVDGKLAAHRTCHGARGCETATSGGGTRCDRTVAIEGEACTTGGSGDIGACDQGQQNGHPRAPTPALFLVRPEHVRHPAEQWRPGCGASGWHSGEVPRYATDGRHYEMLRICFTDCASTLAGSGWKLTWARYVDAAPSFGLMAHSRSERIPLAVVLLGCLVETMAYS